VAQLNQQLTLLGTGRRCGGHEEDNKSQALRHGRFREYTWWLEATTHYSTEYSEGSLLHKLSVERREVESTMAAFASLMVPI